MSEYLININLKLRKIKNKKKGGEKEMKKALLPILVLSLVLTMLLTTIPAQAAEKVDIQEAIEAGVTWLVDQQIPDGSWDACETVALTGFAVVKLEERAFEQAISPFDPGYEYSENVIDGLDYIFSESVEDDCGIHFESPCSGSNHSVYSTGIAMIAIAAGGDMDRIVSVGNPVVDGMTYGEVLEANVAYFANVQQPSGGFGYRCGGSDWNPDWADNSNSGYAVLGLRYAETVGVEIPQTIKDNLNIWIDYIQNDVDGDDNDGGSGYTGPEDWVNLLKTGNLLFEMAFVGDTVATQRVIDAIDYIERHWNDPNSDPGWRPHHYQAMYCIMKGLEVLNIHTITVGVVEVDWFDEFADAIIDSQTVDGYWPADNWGDEILSTEWALLVLEKVFPNSPPIADAGDDQIVEQTSYEGAEVTLDGSGSTDDGKLEPLTYTWTWNGNSASGVSPTVTLPLGTTTITLTVFDGEYEDSDTVIISVVDTTPPEVECLETVNPHGKKVPPAGSTTVPGPKGGQNEDGFYELNTIDICDPNPEIYVVDTGSGMVFGPLPSGTKIKYTEDPDATPVQKKMGSNKGRASSIDWHIIGNGDACVYAVDSSGNQAECVSCLVPPLPK